MRPALPHVDPVVTTLSVAVAAGGFLLHALLGPPSTPWTIDDAGKRLVLANLKEDAGRTWIRYPGAALDPEFRWFPQPLDGPEPYGVVREGRVVSQYLSPFVGLTLPFERLLGDTGLAALPALSAGAAVLLIGALAARRSGRSAGRLAALIFAFATPLLFYASVFWEHAPAAALAAGVFLALAVPDRSRPLLAGALAGAACLLREEMFLLVIACAAALPLAGRRSELPRFLGGGAAGVIAWLVIQRVTTGSWTGVHVAVNAPVPFIHAAKAARALLLDPGFSGVPLVAVVVLLALLATRLAPVAALVLAAVSAAALARFPGGQDQALALIRSNSALVFVPWTIALAGLRPAASGPARHDLLVVAPLLFVAAFVVLVPERSITGVHPGPRMLLPVLPAAAVLAAERFPRRLPAAVAFSLTLVVASAWSVRSLALLHDKREASGALHRALAADPRRLVATDLFWLPTDAAPLWDRKQFHLVRGPDDLAELARRAADSGEREMLLVTAPGRVTSPPLVSLRPARLPAFAADFHVQPLDAGSAP
ncbi:MAG: hypothetical protein ACT4PE_01875 [Candidatus Eiseniibacteriota bacterium]